MGILEKLLESKIKSEGYRKEDAKGITKAQILAEMEPDTVQLVAAMPNSVMESVWKALGVEDDGIGKPDSE